MQARFLTMQRLFPWAPLSPPWQAVVRNCSPPPQGLVHWVHWPSPAGGRRRAGPARVAHAVLHCAVGPPADPHALPALGGALDHSVGRGVLRHRQPGVRPGEAAGAGGGPGRGAAGHACHPAAVHPALAAAAVQLRRSQSASEPRTGVHSAGRWSGGTWLPQTWASLQSRRPWLWHILAASPCRTSTSLKTRVRSSAAACSVREEPGDGLRDRRGPELGLDVRLGVGELVPAPPHVRQHRGLLGVRRPAPPAAGPGHSAPKAASQASRSPFSWSWRPLRRDVPCWIWATSEASASASRLRRRSPSSASVPLARQALPSAQVAPGRPAPPRC